MRTALDLPTDSLHDEERRFIADIREHGWFRTTVSGDEEGPSFSFTTGFWLNAGFPEILCFSLKSETLHSVFWDLFRDVKAGRVPSVAAPTGDIFGNLDAVLLPVALDQYADHLGWSRWFYRGDDFPCLQLVWPDRAGRFPWQPGFDEGFRQDQVDLTEKGWLASLGH